MSDTPEQQFSILKFYLKDASLETPHSPEIFREQGQPEINFQLNNDNKKIDEDIYESILTVTVTAKINGKNAYLAEVHFAGLFSIVGFAEAQLEPILAITCPHTLYPFANEALHALITKAGFPPLVLNPIDFEGLYRRQKEKQTQEQQAAAQH